MPYGTGFIAVSVHGRDEVWQTVVTAKHVIEDIPGGIVSIRVNTHDGEARIIKTLK
jgi:hypothetical protein